MLNAFDINLDLKFPLKTSLCKSTSVSLFVFSFIDGKVGRMFFPTAKLYRCCVFFSFDHNKFEKLILCQILLQLVDFFLLRQ